MLVNHKKENFIELFRYCILDNDVLFHLSLEKLIYYI